MDKVVTPWPPHVGDHIQFVATGASGQVMHITTNGDSRQFVIGVFSNQTGKVTTAPHRAFRLEDLCPASVPPMVVIPAAASGRRRAVKQPTA